MHAEDLAILSGTFIIPKVLIWHVLKRKKIIWKSRKIKRLKKNKIKELIILSGNILSWTVCVESSCFLTPVGGSLPLGVLLCFRSPSVSLVVSWHLYSSEGWGRAGEKKKKRVGGGGYPAQLTSVMALQLSSSAKRLQSCFSRGHNLKRFSYCHEPKSLQRTTIFSGYSRSGKWSKNSIFVYFTFFFFWFTWSWQPQTCDSKFHKSADRLPCLCHNSGKIQMCKTFNLPAFKRYLINLKCFSTILPSGAVACI